MKYTDLPFPGTNNEKVRAELAAAVNRVDQAKGGGAQELTDCLQAAIDHLSQYIAPPIILGDLFFDDGVGNALPQDSTLDTLSPGDTLTPTYILQLEGEDPELISATDPRLGRFQVGQTGGGYGSSNAWLSADEETGVITALETAESYPIGDGPHNSVRRELIIDNGSEGIGFFYAFARVNWAPIEE